MACDCIRLTNEALAEHNTELGVKWTMDRETGRVNEYVAIQTEIKEKKRGARPIAILPVFCPFCGVKYESDETEPPSRPGAGLGARA